MKIRMGIPRGQLILYQHCIDEMVAEENIVRFIDAYIDSMDMYARGFRMNEKKAGRLHIDHS